MRTNRIKTTLIVKIRVATTIRKSLRILMKIMISLRRVSKMDKSNLTQMLVIKQQSLIVL